MSRRRPASATAMKRKNSTLSQEKSKKRTKPHSNRKAVDLDSLPWSTSADAAKAARGVFDDESTGFMLGGLEEVSDVEVVYSEQEDGRKTASFVVAGDKLSDSQKKSAGGEPGSEAAAEDEDEVAQDDEEWGGIAASSESEGEPEASTSQLPDMSTSASAHAQASPPPKSSAARVLDLQDQPFERIQAPALGRLPIFDALKHALYACKFNKPTPIQSAAWKQAFTATSSIASRDLVGVAQTGSGKTLAYGLPLLQYALQHPEHSVSALVLTPTRELALQVRKHLATVLDSALVATASKGTRAPVSILGLTGGMSLHKQRRQLDQGAHILVGTPGRVWDLVSQDVGLAKQLKQLQFLVLDEADRMVESGHFAELEKIFDLTNRKTPGKSADAEPEFVNDFEHEEEAPESIEASSDMRTYVFSATMSKELQKNLKKPAGKRRIVNPEDRGELGALGSLMETLDFRDPDPEVIDLLPEGGKVSSLLEAGIDCLASDKDLHLYHFLLRYPGKSIVFLASIDGIRRLHPLLSLLDLGQVIMLHSGMQQKARLKALDRFKSAEKAVLLATDVAARGLDVPEVDHVVHYQLPRTADTYVHRSGRTARAGREGVSLQLVSPEEKTLQKMIFHSLHREVKELSSLPVEWTIMDRLKQRIELAKRIESAHHKVTKQNHEDHWLKEAAEAMDVDLDELSSDDDRKRLKKSKSTETHYLKNQLAEELKRPLVVKGISSKYITSGLQPGFADAMVNNTNHSNIVGMRQGQAKLDAKSKQ